MKYPAHIYAKALVEVLAVSDGSKAKEDVAAENFLALVRKNGDEGHLRKILEEAARFAREHGPDGENDYDVALDRRATRFANEPNELVVV